jgi:hypothetical protein
MTPTITPPTKPTQTISFPKPIIAIIGDSGTGKSTSFRNMPWDKTRFIDVERKGLPFDYSGITNYVAPTHSDAVILAMVEAAKAKTPYCIVDSLTKFFEYALNESKDLYKGFDIYKAFADKVRRLLNAARSNDTVFIFTGIPELLKITSDTGSETIARRLFVYGKEWEGKVEKEFLIVFYTANKKDKTTGKITYHFLTNTDGVCSAKSPMGMFADALIDNDTAAALKKIGV